MRVDSLICNLNHIGIISRERNREYDSEQRVAQSEKVTESDGEEESERNKFRLVERSIMVLFSPSPV